MKALYDVIISGAGPAGLTAALVLGRSRRQVLLLDGGPPRNADTGAAHGVFTRDNTPPLELKRQALADLRRYPVTVRQEQAAAARRSGECFEVTLQGGETVRARTLLLATGLEDLLPDIPGFREGWGRTVLHCPYCDGWEHRGRRLAVYGGDRGAADAAHHMALTLRLWSPEVCLLAGDAEAAGGFSEEQRRDLDRLGIELISQPLSRLEGAGPLRVTLEAPEGGPAGGRQLALDAVFYSPQQRQRSPLAAQLGCALTANGRVQADELGRTGQPGVYAAGDMAGAPQYVMNAAASGSSAAVAINTALIHAEREAQGAEFHRAAQGHVRPA